MTAANNSPKPTEEMWNAPVMMEFKHNTGLGESVGTITEDAPIGSKTITASLAGVSGGSWICLVLENTDDNVINSELYPHNGKILRYSKAVLPISRQKGFRYTNIIRLRKSTVTMLSSKSLSCMPSIKTGDGKYTSLQTMPMLV